MNVDYLIIGQGLAGTVLAYQLIKINKTVLIFDQFDENSSSRVAAGLFNPITGKRFVKTWQVDKLFPFAVAFYKKLERSLNDKFLCEEEIYRPFNNYEEQNEWNARSSDMSYLDYVSKVYNSTHFRHVLDPYGGILIKKSGVVFLPEMLGKMRAEFIKDGILIEEKFDLNFVKYNHSIVRYGEIEAKRMIFCNGFKGAENPLFSWLPFRLVKGEVLHLKPNVEIDKIYIRGCFITPQRDGISRCGSTYDWKYRSAKPTDKGRKIILGNLRKLMDINYKIVDHKAGIRPATNDRRPFIGVHPEYKTIGIFNGLGTKGITLAPYYANQFVAHLENGGNLDSEVDIKRYYSLYYNSFSS